MQQYLDLLNKIKNEGFQKEPARENMPTTKSIFGHEMRFNLQDGFPIITTKKVSFKNILGELLWFLKGDSNIKYLIDNNINIWNEDAYNYYVKKIKNTNHNNLYMPCNSELGIRGSDQPDSYSLFTFDEFVSIIKNKSVINLIMDYSASDYMIGDTGNSYPVLWRSWGDKSSIDQIKNVIENIIKNPFSRRHIVTAWNPDVIESGETALPPCHAMFQFNCRPLNLDERLQYWDKNIFTIKTTKPSLQDLEINSIPKYELSCKLYQRSADLFLG